MCGRKLSLASSAASTGRPPNEVLAASASSTMVISWMAEKMTLCPSEASVSWASTVVLECGTTENLRISAPRPISIPPSRMPSQTSVCCARRALGWRNSGTAFAIASTPVSAEQPEANALSTSKMPTASAEGPRRRSSATGGRGRAAGERLGHKEGAEGRGGGPQVMVERRRGVGADQAADDPRRDRYDE